MSEAAPRGAISLETVVAAARDQVASDLADEKVILSISSGRYYGLRDVGKRIWEAIAEPRCVAEIRDLLVSEYDVEPDRCERDLLALLQELAERGLVEIRGGAAS